MDVRPPRWARARAFSGNGGLRDSMGSPATGSWGQWWKTTGHHWTMRLKNWQHLGWRPCQRTWITLGWSQPSVNSAILSSHPSFRSSGCCEWSAAPCASRVGPSTSKIHKLKAWHCGWFPMVNWWKSVEHVPFILSNYLESPWVVDLVLVSRSNHNLEFMVHLISLRIVILPLVSSACTRSSITWGSRRWEVLLPRILNCSFSVFAPGRAWCHQIGLVLATSNGCIINRCLLPSVNAYECLMMNHGDKSWLDRIVEPITTGVTHDYRFFLVLDIRTNITSTVV